MAPLRGLKSLGLHLGKQVDRRTAEKVLLAAGAVPDSEGTEQLTTLSIRVHFAGPGTDDVSLSHFAVGTPAYRNCHRPFTKS
jgi:hypothetical protein